MKKVMIIGAGPLQIPAIKKLKSYGMEVYACDYNVNAEGFLYADKKLLISTIDKEKVLEAAETIKPDHIITSTTDAPVVTVAYVREKLGMQINISYKNAICATNKAEMRKRLKDCNIPIPSFFVCQSLDDFQKMRLNFEKEYIIKPVDSAASRGVKLISNNLSQNQLVGDYNNAVGHSRTGTVIIEEFMEGPEVSVECIIYRGRVFVIAITDKLVCELPYFVELGHSEPAVLKDDVKEHIEKVAIKCVEAIGIINGCAHVEMKITPKGPMVVEIAARLGGDYITSRLVPLSTGIDMVEASVDVEIGRPFEFKPNQNKGSAIRFLYGSEGIIKSIKVPQELFNLKGVEEIKLYKNTGSHINDLRSSNDRIGHIITSGDTVEKAVCLAEQVLKEIEIITK